MSQLTRLNEGDPFIICGDFNSLPGSVVYEYLSNGFIDSKSAHFGTLFNTYSGLFANADITRQYMEQKHGIQTLKCAYNDDTFMMPFTNRIAGKFSGVIDYIWYSSDTLRPIALLNDLKDGEEYDENLTLPNENHRSDHLPLMAAFERFQ